MINRIANKEPAAWSKGSEIGSTPNKSLPIGSLHDLMTGAEKLVSDHPGAALVVAFLTGATIAWWLKRR
jgi:hypothetical protein